MHKSNIKKELIKFKEENPFICTNVFFNISQYKKVGYNSHNYHTMIINSQEYTALIEHKVLYTKLYAFLEKLINEYWGSILLVNIFSLDEINPYSQQIKYSIITL